MLQPLAGETRTDADQFQDGLRSQDKVYESVHSGFLLKEYERLRGVFYISNIFYTSAPRRTSTSGALSCMLRRPLRSETQALASCTQLLPSCSLYFTGEPCNRLRSRSVPPYSTLRLGEALSAWLSTIACAVAHHYGEPLPIPPPTEMRTAPMLWLPRKNWASKPIVVQT